VVEWLRGDVEPKPMADAPAPRNAVPRWPVRPDDCVVGEKEECCAGGATKACCEPPRCAEDDERSKEDAGILGLRLLSLVRAYIDVVVLPFGLALLGDGDEDDERSTAELECMCKLLVLITSARARMRPTLVGPLITPLDDGAADDEDAEPRGRGYMFPPAPAGVRPLLSEFDPAAAASRSFCCCCATTRYPATAYGCVCKACCTASARDGFARDSRSE
jgi:hypothetical protein